MVGDTILIKDISINGNSNLDTASELSETLTNNTINALGIDASSRTVWINGQPYGNAYVNVNGDSVEAPIGAEIFNDFEHNTASGAYSHAEGSETSAAGDYSHAEGKGTKTTNEAEHASGKYNISNTGSTIFSVGIGTSNDDRKNAVEVMQNGDAYVIGIGGYDGKNLNSATKLQDAVSNSVNITWEKLKDARDTGELVPGKQYRITDYVCTTIQEGTKAKDNKFDIIVTADSANTLNEEARAALHEGDSYFANNDLNAWKIWYCIDNDTNRFTWADSVNGKGVIYRMIDEFDNDCPYDFKNIQFYRKWDSNLSLWSTISSDADNTALLCYTFSSVGDDSTISFTDMSLVASNNIYSNVINAYVNNNKQTLNNICFFGGNCYSNTFGTDCKENTFGQGCRSNIFENKCYSNILGIGCYSNIFENDCRYNIFRTNCYSNSVGSNFQNNSFGNNCYSNTFGNSCHQNVFDAGCYSNTLGNSCRSNKFGSTCYSNTFGNRCQYNIFGNNCQYNTLENGCSFIKFTTNSNSESPKYSFYQNNHFEDGCQYIVFTGKYTAAPNEQVQNYKFAQGLQGTSEKYLTIDGKRNRTYETYISKDTNDKVKESIVAEKLDKMIEIKYDVLVELWKSDELIPGQQYRITDYDFTTRDANTDSAHKLFDIIVTADSKSTLNENARAIQHQYMGAIKLYKTATIKDESGHIYADAVDFADYFLLAGTVEVDGVTYYRYDKYDHNGAGPELINAGRYILLESINLDSRNVSLDNPLSPVGGGTYSGDGSYVHHTEDNIVAYENGFIDPSIIDIDPLYERDLASWELKYTISNNYHSAYNGKGTILWMKDDYRNECNYDFINALFKVYKITYCRNYPDLRNTYAIKPGTYDSTNITYGDETKLVSTFGNNNHDNIIKFGDEAARLKNTLLPYIVLGSNCSYNIFGNDCYQNTIGDRCTSNIFGNGCTENILRNDCTSNTFGNDCTKNILGDYCTSNTLGNGCTGNTIRNDCTSNTFGNKCSSNIFVQTCSSNTLGNDCSSNTFAKGCKYNIFGNNCQDNRLQTECSSNTFGNDCYSIIFSSSSSETSNIDIKYKYNRLGDGCQYIDFKGVEQGTTPIQVQNYNFAQGLQGTPDNRLPIIGYSGLKYEMRVARNKNGDPKTYCIDN